MDTKVISSGKRYTTLPESYIRPEADRPNLSEVSTCEDLPVIDLGCANRAQIVEAIAYACSVFGFFQVISPKNTNFKAVQGFASLVGSVG